MKLLIAGGGTGGHVFPAIAIAREYVARARDRRVVFVGTERGLEKTIVPKAGFPLEFISVGGIKGKVLFSSYPIEGARGRRNEDTPKPRGVVESFDLENQKQDRLFDGVSDFWIGRDGKTLLYQSGDRLRVPRTASST